MRYAALTKLKESLAIKPNTVIVDRSYLREADGIPRREENGRGSKLKQAGRIKLVINHDDDLQGVDPAVWPGCLYYFPGIFDAFVPPKQNGGLYVLCTSRVEKKYIFWKVDMVHVGRHAPQLFSSSLFWGR